MTGLLAFWQDPTDGGGGGGPDPPTIMWDADAITGTSGWFTSELPLGSTASATGTWEDDDSSALEPVDEIWLEMYGRVRGGTVSPLNGSAAFEGASGVWSYSESDFKLTDDGKPITAKIRDFDDQVAEETVTFFFNMQDPLQRLIGHPNARGPSTGNYWEWQADGLSSGGTSWGGYTPGFHFIRPTTGYGGCVRIATDVATDGNVCRLIATTANGIAGKSVQPNFGIAVPMDVEINIEILINTGSGIVSQGTETFAGPIEFSGRPDETTISLPPYDLEDGDVMYVRIWGGGDGFVISEFPDFTEDPLTHPIWQWTNMRVISQVEAAKVPTDVVDANGIFVDPVAGTFPTNETDFINNYIGDPTNPIKAHELWAKDSYQNLMPAGTYTIYQKAGTVADQMTCWNAIFPGTNNYVDLNSTLIGATVNFAIEMDIKLDAYPSSGEWAVLSQYTAGSAGRLLLSVLSNGKARFFIENGGAPDNISIDSLEAIPIGEWTTLGIHRSGDKFDLTVDRVPNGEQTETGVSVQSRDTMVGSDDGNLNDFDGRMRNFVFYVDPDSVGKDGTETKFLTQSVEWIGGATVSGGITTEEAATGDALVMKGSVTSGTHLGDRKSFTVKPWDYTYGAKPVIYPAGIFPTSTPRYGKGQIGAVTFRNCINSSIEGYTIRDSKHNGIIAEVDVNNPTTCDNVTISDCFVDRSGTDSFLLQGKGNEGAFTIYPVTNVTLKNCRGREAAWGMQLSPNHISGATGVVEPMTGQACTIVHSTDCEIQNVVCRDYNKEGFDGISSARITFSDCRAKRNENSVYGGSRGNAFYVDASQEGVEDITFERCVCEGDSGGFGITSEAGGPLTRIKVTSCVSYGTTSSALAFSDESQTGVVVTDCGFEHCSVLVETDSFVYHDTLGSPVISGSEGIYVRNCIFKGTRSDMVASDNGFTGWNIENNWFYTTNGSGVLDPASQIGSDAIVDVDPLFTSTTDLRLSASSTAGAIELTLSFALTTDNITSVVVNETIPTVVPTSGTIELIDNDGVYRTLDYSSYTGSTFTITTTNGEEDFATVNANGGNSVWAGGIDPAIRTLNADGEFVNPTFDNRGAY